MQTIWKESYTLSFLNSQCPHQDYWGTHTPWNINQHVVRFSRNHFYFCFYRIMTFSTIWRLCHWIAITSLQTLSSGTKSYFYCFNYQIYNLLVLKFYLILKKKSRNNNFKGFLIKWKMWKILFFFTDRK
jgi:hypothetical protein